MGLFIAKFFYNNDLQSDIQLNISTSVTRLCFPPGLFQQMGGSPG